MKKRKPMLEETKRKISNSNKGCIPWNKGKKGLQTSWCKGTKGLVKPNKGSFTSKKLKEKWSDLEYKEIVSKKISKARKGKKLTEKHKEALRGSRPNQAGDKNHNWKGGYINDRKQGELVIYKIWRLNVFERDYFTCQLCKIRGGKLEAHHIRKWRDYLELRYKLNNGITLCKKCHNKTKRKEEKFEKLFIEILKTRDKLGVAL